MGLGFLLALVSAVTGIQFFRSDIASPTTSRVRRVALRIPPGTKPFLQGTVSDREEHPIQGALVNLFLAGPDAKSAPPVEKKTGPQGTFAFADLEPGVYRVHVFAAGKRSALVKEARLEGRTPALDLRFTLGEGRELAGVVRDASGKPAPSRTVTARPTDAIATECATTTDADGFFRLEGLGEGPYDLIVQGTGTVSLTKRTAGVRRTEIGASLAGVPH